MHFALFNQRSFALDHHPRQPRPVLVVLVDDDGDPRVDAQVAHALEICERNTFRFGIKRCVELQTVQDEHDRNDVGDAVSVCRGQSGHARGSEKAQLALGERRAR